MKVGKGWREREGYCNSLNEIMRVCIKRVAERNENEKHYVICRTWELIGHREWINREGDGFKLEY